MTRLDNSGTWIEHLRPYVSNSAMTSVAIFEGGAGAPGSPRAVESYIESRIGDLPYFRRRIQRAPLGLGNCRLVADTEFDLGNHVDVRSCPGGGSWLALRAEVARLRQEKLDPRRPPWHITVITGISELPGRLHLLNGRPAFAVVTRLEHSVTDGAGSVAFARRLFPETPYGPKEHPLPDGGNSGGTLPMFVDTALQVPSRVMQFGRDAREVLRRRSKNHKGTEATVDVTRSQPDALVPQGEDYVYDTRVYSVAEVRPIRSLVADATINDLFVSVIGGALRSYLAARGELPDDDLGCALSLATAKRESPYVGNDFAMAVIPFWTTVNDPEERLRRVVASTRTMKRRVRTGPNVPLQRALQACPPMFIPKVLSRLSNGNSVVSSSLVNVPRGPRPMYFGDARSVASFSVPFADGIALAHAVSSLGDVLTLGVLYDNAAIDDGDAYLAEVDAELERLRVCASR